MKRTIQRFTSRRDLATAAAVVIGATSAQGALDFRFYGDFFGGFPDEAIAGTAYTDLLNAGSFPDDPIAVDNHPAPLGFFTSEESSFVTSGFIEWPQDDTNPAFTNNPGNSGSDNFGIAFSGIFYPPETSSYRFHLRSDDGSALFFNPDGPEFLDLDTASPVAMESGCCGAFEQSGETVSPSFDLVEGQGYAFEFLMKEGGGGDWFQIGWSQNGGEVSVIPMWYVQRDVRYGEPSQDGIVFDNPQEFPFALEGTEFCCIGVEFDLDGVADIQWQVDDGGGWEDLESDGNIYGVNSPAIGFDRVLLEWDGNEYRPIVNGEEGEAIEFEVDVDDDPPELVRVFGNAFPQGIIVEFNEAVDMDTATDPANYTFSPEKGINSIQPVEGASNQVVISLDAFSSTEDLTLTVSGVTDLADSANEIDDTPRAVQLVSGVISYLPFSAALDANDVTGTYNGTGMGDFDITTDGDRGEVGSFDGDDDYVTFGSPNTGFDGLDGAGVFSMSVWFNRQSDRASDDTNHGVSNIIFANSAGSSNDTWEVGTEGATVDGYTDTGGGAQDSNWAAAQAGIENDTWHHMVTVLDGSAATPVRVYIDGELVFEDDRFTGSLETAAATEWTIGLARPDNQLWGDFDGQMDDFAIYDIALTQEIIDALQTLSPLQALGAGYGDLSFVSEPQAQETIERRDVTFSAEVEGSLANNIEYRWFKNGEMIPGEQGPTLTVFAELADNGATYSVLAANNNGSGVQIQSAEATLTVMEDVDAPQIVGASAQAGGSTVIVDFDEEVNVEDAENVDNYSVEGRDVNSATLLASGMSVELDIGLVFGDSVIDVTASNIRDLSSNENALGSANASAVVNSGLINYLTFNSSADDLLGVFNGTVVGNVTFVDDSERGGVADFDGADSYITLGSPNTGFGVLNDTTVFSLSVWFNRREDRSDDATNHGVTNVILANSANGSNDDYEIGTTGDAIGGYLDTAGADTSFPDSPASIEDDTWHHLVTVYDANASEEIKVYVDGELVYSASNYGGAIDSADATEWTLGIARPDNELWGDFNGLMDDFALFNVGLSAESVQALFDGSANPSKFAVPDGFTFGAANITAQPQSQSVIEGEEVTLSIGLDGTPPVLVDWTKDGAPVTGATTTTTLSSITFIAEAADDGAVFQATVSNDEGSATSDEAVLSVALDTTAPTVTSIEAKGLSINEITIAFDEPLDPASAENTSNYSVEGLDITGATLSADGTTVVLTTSQQENRSDYNVSISGIADASVTGNVIADTTETVTSLFNYTDVVLADGPDGYFKLGDSDRTQAINLVNDSWTGNGNSGSGGVEPQLTNRIVVGSPDGAALFELGQDSRFQIPDNAAFNNGGPYGDEEGEDRVIELWFNAETVPDQTQYAYIFEEGGVTRGLSIYLNDGQLFMHAWNDAADGVGAPWGGPLSEDKEAIFVATEVEPNTTYHAVMILDFDNSDDFEGELIGYLNGEEFGRAPGVGLLYDHGDDGGLGAIQQNSVQVEDNNQVGFGAPFTGVIDEFAVYNTMLSEEQIAFHYEVGNTEVPADPIDVGPGGGDAEIVSFGSDGANISIEYTGTLQSATSVAGPYEDVAGASSPYTAPIAGGGMFYRVVE